MSKWTPSIGEETNALLDSLKIDDTSKYQLLSEAERILSRCVNPDGSVSNSTGLVIGHVQSGKTLSFTTVTSLARDNGFQLIIIITGTSVPLTEQSVKRIRKDLRLEDRPDRRWLFVKNPKMDDNFRQIRDRLAEWRDNSLPVYLRHSVLITVMKHHGHLNSLHDLLVKLPLDDVPSLIIDDEGDQASLNTKIQQGDTSTTYNKILQLRSILNCHSYLQYTATPQAPLLISIIDTLSPDFAEVLEPGQGYVGGDEFFNHQKRVLRRIPESDLVNESDQPGEPPESLKKALRVFLIGTVVGMIQDREFGNRTMLVHPSHRTSLHATFTSWVNHIKDNWVTILGLSHDDPDYVELRADFKDAYADLSKTANDLPPFSEVVNYLLVSTRRTVVLEVNASKGKTPQVDWANSYAHILVGGQAMDRGFTVEGLTVMYMPRSLGVGNADTLQQRARFYGYKKDYLRLCRVFLSEQLSDAYTDYVDHELSIRSELRELELTGQSLGDWRRQFLLPTGLQPTRSNVIAMDYVRENFEDRWITAVSPYYEKSVVAANLEIAQSFFASADLSPDTGDYRRTAIQRHMVVGQVALRYVYEDLLLNLRFLEPSYTGAQLQISNFLSQHPETKCTVFQMSSDKTTWLTRERGLGDSDRISNLMQGPDPGRERRTYPGDRNIGDRSRVIVQLHKLNLTRQDEVIARDVLAVGIWIPKALSAGWLVQEDYRQNR